VMCISYPGRVLQVIAGDAIVETAGRRRHATTLLLPDVAVGDWVIVGGGAILRRLDPAGARELIATLDGAARRTAALAPAEGGRP
jgi:hydrogenase assembly chaperone HypC/HupF